MTNSEIAREIIRVAEQEHINLYHSVSKEAIYKQLDKICLTADNMDQKEFDYNMTKLFAMFKDAHTSYGYKELDITDHKFLYLNKNLYILQEGKYLPVKSINNFDTKTIIRYMSEIIEYENDAWKSAMLNSVFNKIYCYKLIGLLNDNCKLSVKTLCGQNIDVNSKARINLSNKPIIPPAKSNFYSFDLLDNILLINYNACHNDDKYSMQSFILDIKNAIEDKIMKGIILDLRGNSGGNDAIVRPLIKFLSETQLPCATLIGNLTFSSGAFDALDAKNQLNAVLIGQQTGGCTTLYGNCKKLEVCGNSFWVSTKFFDKTYTALNTEKK